MSKPIRWIVCGLLLAACSGDDDGDGDGQTAGSDAGGSQSTAGTSAGRGGTTAGSNAGGRGGSAGSTTAGSGGTTAGTGGTTAGTGGTTAGSGGSTAGSDAGQDSGTDSGMPSNATVCKAPTTNATSGNTCPGAGTNPPALKLTPIKMGLDVPIFVTQPPGDDSRLFVVLRSGRILLVDPDDGADMGEFMNVPDVSAGGEMGLLGLTFHPDFPEDPRFFVNFTRDEAELETVIASFELMAGNPDRGDPGSFVSLLTFNQPQSNHNGGMVAFGPDGCLYVGAGDGGNSNDEGAGHPAAGNGQTLTTPLGKILRIDVDNPMMSPPGNLGGAGTHRHIWAYGMRNPWRFSFDRSKGDMYIGDVGQGTWEEVDVEPKGAGGKNYGWKIMEGEHCFGGACDMNGLVLPIHEYQHAGGDDCIIGGYVYRGSKIQALQGWYLFADNGPGPGGMNSTTSPRSVWALVWDGEKSCQDVPPQISDLNDFNIYSDITSFGEDANGELYITTMNAVYRIDPQ